ncbi:acyl-CoA synthetase [Corynebacterium glutamicum]|uniref:acyl-CoA synthetase n=1 Tax=Corynebacterium glutamicum TaxID=1718 RepID=UPI0012F94F93|nr:acyl-CoA synthetase [Corynebacterium glutamicum]
MESIDELLNLIQRGAETTVSMDLTVTRTQKSSGYSGWHLGENLLKYIEADGLTVHYSSNSLHLTRGDEDILRGVGSMRWLFNEDDFPISVNSKDLKILGGVRFYIDPLSIIRALRITATDPSAITKSSVLERDTWVIPSATHGFHNNENQLQIIEIDAEAGVILAVESNRERIEVSSVSFPSELPDPTWVGSSIEWANPEDQINLPETIPHEITTLPAQPENPRHLRIWISEDTLEGAYPKFKVGESVRLALHFRSDPAPIASLETTRRGWIEHLGDPIPGPKWPVRFIGDGWSADSSITTPAYSDIEMKGWFSYANDIEKNDVRVLRIYGGIGVYNKPERLWQELDNTTDAFRTEDIRLRDTVLDVTVDGAVSPPLQPLRFERGSTHVVDGKLWVLHYYSPVLRCWDLETGYYLGQTFVPVSLQSADSLSFAEQFIHNDDIAWRLVPGAHALSDPQPWSPSSPKPGLKSPLHIPEPWELMSDLADGLYSLCAYSEYESRIALGRMNAKREIEICPIPSDGISINYATRVGDEYFVNLWQISVTIDSDFHITSLQYHHPAAAPWSWFVSEGVAVNTDEKQILFVEQDSTSEITHLETLPDCSPQIEVHSPSHFTVLMIPHNTNSHTRSLPVPSSISIFQSGQWITTRFETAPGEI